MRNERGARRTDGGSFVRVEDEGTFLPIRERTFGPRSSNKGSQILGGLLKEQTWLQKAGSRRRSEKARVGEKSAVLNLKRISLQGISRYACLTESGQEGGLQKMREKALRSAGFRTDFGTTSYVKVHEKKLGGKREKKGPKKGAPS